MSPPRLGQEMLWLSCSSHLSLSVVHVNGSQLLGSKIPYGGAQLAKDWAPGALISKGKRRTQMSQLYNRANPPFPHSLVLFRSFMNQVRPTALVRASALFSLLNQCWSLPETPSQADVTFYQFSGHPSHLLDWQKIYPLRETLSVLPLVQGEKRHFIFLWTNWVLFFIRGQLKRLLEFGGEGLFGRWY